MQSTRKVHPQQGAAWLNGIAWVLIVVCLVVFISLSGTIALWALTVLLLVAGLGTVANLALCLLWYAKGHRQQTQAYLVGLLTLALPFGTLCFVLVSIAKFAE